MNYDLNNPMTMNSTAVSSRRRCRRVALLNAALFSGLSLGACDTPSKNDDCAPGHEGECDTNALSVCGDGASDDPVTIVSGAIEGDTLVLEVSYGGGCEPHSFGGCWDGGFDLSHPPGAGLSLWHDANGDSCEAALEELIEISLVPMKLAYQDGDPEVSGPIIVNVEGLGETLEYSF